MSNNDDDRPIGASWAHNKARWTYSSAPQDFSLRNHPTRHLTEVVRAVAGHYPVEVPSEGSRGWREIAAHEEFIEHRFKLAFPIPACT
jgi:hypothetical protein